MAEFRLERTVDKRGRTGKKGYHFADGYDKKGWHR